MPKRTSLPSMLPPACSALAAWSTPSGPSSGLPACSAGVMATTAKATNMHRHRRQHRPALARVAHHAAEGEAQRRRDQEDRQHLQQVATGAVGFS